MNTVRVSQVETDEHPSPLEIVVEPLGYVYVKRALDILLSLTLMVILLPLFMIIALSITIEDGAPILYFHQRTGLKGQAFRFYKFRTMYRNADTVKRVLKSANEADGPIFKMRQDPRVTKVGKILRRLSLDETPQLINVLRGEMSFVGPRPLPKAEADECTSVQYRRHSIKPGLLCYREVTGRSKLSFETWMESDLDYVDNHNLKVDAAIILKAIPAIIRGDGAY